MLPEPDTSDELIEYLDLSAATAKDWLEISAALLARERSTGDIQAGWLMTAFDYHLARRVSDGRLSKEAFGEKFAMGGSHYPTPLGHVPVEVIALWSHVAERVSTPSAKARLHHLLFERGEGNRGTRGREAAAGYLALGTASWSRLERANCLHWALDLSKLVGDSAAAAAVLPALISLASESLDQEKREPGVALHALEVLAYEDPGCVVLPALLERARAAYRDPFLTGHTIRIQEQVFKADQAKRQQLRRDMVLSYYDHAMSFPPGLLRMTFLEDAAKVSGQYGLTDLAQRAIEGMQAMTLDDLDLKTFSVSVPIAAGAIDAHVAAVIGQRSFPDVLQLLVTLEPPTGNFDRNERSTDEIGKQTPFAALIPTKHLGDDGLARYTATSDEDRMDERLARTERISLAIAGPVAAEILAEALHKFAPTVDDIVGMLERRPHVSRFAAISIAKALVALGAGNHEVAATIAMPRIETLVRALCQERGVLRFRVQRDQKQGPSTRGQYPQLGALLGQLRPWLDPSWYRFLWTFLVSPFGPNFRNELVHGFTEEVTAAQAALTILASLHLALVPLADADGDDPNSPPDPERTRDRD